jgi:hypothetical protein
LLTMTGTSHVRQPQNQLYKHNSYLFFNNRDFWTKSGCPYQNLCQNCRGPHSAISCGIRTSTSLLNWLNNFRPRVVKPQGPRLSAPQAVVGVKNITNCH